MRKRIQRENIAPELAVAIGLVWGHLQASQFEEAYKLAQGCLRLWPQEHRLTLMAAYASVELLEPLDATAMAALDSTACVEWAELIRKRHDATVAALGQDGAPGDLSC
jgi:hypothetical protein